MLVLSPFASHSHSRSHRPSRTRRLLVAVGVAAALLVPAGLAVPSVAFAGTCPVPACVPGEIVGTDGTIPANARGIVYRSMQGKYIHSSPDSGIDDAGDPIPPRYYEPNAEILDDKGVPVASSLDDDVANPVFKVLKPAGGLRPNTTYKVRYDRECATGSTAPPTVVAEVKTGEVAPVPLNVGTVEIVSKRVDTLDVPNPDDAGACTVKKEVSVVRIRFKPSAQLVPYAKVLGFRASLDNVENGPLRYQIGNPDGTLETDVYVPCPTDERSVKAEVIVRTIGAEVTPPGVTADVTVLACGGGAAATDGGADGGSKAAAASGCSCDTTSEGGGGTAGLTFALGAMATALLVRGLARKRSS